MISRNTIDKVFEIARVEEVIGDFVELKRAGSNLKGLSPFVQEKTPSFMVSPTKQIWKDFSSGKGGNVVSFLMEQEQMTYPEAIKYLAKKYNIEIEEVEDTPENKEQASLKESMYLVSEFAQKHYKHNLFQTDEGKSVGLSYFKNRGFTDATIERFGLGYAMDSWSDFSQKALNEGYKSEFLEQTGLSSVNDKGITDRFRARVMFPIYTISGRVAGFGARTLLSDKKVAKYLNSPESEIYHKSKILYGIYQARQSILKNDLCYLVEGYTDVIQMYQSGVENVVASSGTALTPEQVKLISRFTKNITVLFDGDSAGLRASIRGIDIILEEGMNVRVCTFPDGEDPDSFAKKLSNEDFQQYIKQNSHDFIRFKASLLLEQTKHDPIKKAEHIRDMVLSIAKIPDRIKKEIYLKETSKIMDISEEVLANTLAQILQKKQYDDLKKETKTEENNKIIREKTLYKNIFLNTIEQNILKILFNHSFKELEFEEHYNYINDENELDYKIIKRKQLVKDKIFMSLQDDEIEFSNPNFKNIYQSFMNHIQENNSFDLQKYIKEMPLELGQEVSDIYMIDDKYHLDRWESKNIFPKGTTHEQVIVQYVEQTIINYRCALIYKLVEQKMTEIQNTPSENNSDILSEIMLYTDLRKRMLAILGNVTPLNHFNN
ncbi:MAG: DNA primase [Bacteroidota bacterium]|nr:DNA primase [Bacteroidota bacterium]